MSEDRTNKAILQVLPELESGGVERGVIDISVYGKKLGYEMLVASSGGKLVQHLEEANVKHCKFNLKTKNPLKIIFNIFRLRKVIKQNKIAIVHARSRAPAWSAYFAAKLTGATYITTFHGFYKRNAPLKHWYNSIMVKGDVIIGVSQFIKKHIVKYYNTGGKKIEVIHRGVNLQEFDVEKITEEDIKDFRGTNGVDSNDIVILLPGRISRWKGQDIAIRAFSELKNKENIKLLICGSWRGNENYYTELVQICKENNLENNVIFAGNISNMPLAFKAGDIALNTSTEPETFGRVSAEANAMGKPVIATNHGGSIEILEGKISGVLVPPKDHIALAKAIEDMLTKIADSDQKTLIEEASIKNVRDNFSLDLMCKKVFSIYDRYINPEV